MYDTMISCQLTCNVFHLQLLPDPFHQSTLLSAPSVVSPKHLFQASPILFTQLDTSSKRFFPVVLPCIECNLKNSSATHKVESTPRMKTDSWPVSEVLLLSLIKCNDVFPFPKAAVVDLRQADVPGQQQCFGSDSHLKNTFFPGRTVSQMQLLIKSPFDEMPR